MVQEVREQVLTAFGVRDLGVELHRVQSTRDVLHDRDRPFGRRTRDDEAFGCGRDRVAVTHPARRARGPLLHQDRAALARHRRATVLTDPGVGDVAAELLGHELRAVTNAQHRDAEFVDRGIERRRRYFVDRLRTAGEDDRGRRLRAHFVSGDGALDDFGIDVCFAHASRDQLRVLGTEVDDEDVLGQCPMPTPWERCNCFPSVWSEGASMISAFWNSFRVS